MPESGGGLIDLIGQVQKWQRSHDGSPIVVHCMQVRGHFIRPKSITLASVPHSASVCAPKCQRLRPIEPASVPHSASVYAP